MLWLFLNKLEARSTFRMGISLKSSDNCTSQAFAYIIGGLAVFYWVLVVTIRCARGQNLLR